jgi:hypothetical protein
MQRHIYRVHLNGSEKKLLTHDRKNYNFPYAYSYQDEKFIRIDQTDQGFYSASFSPKATYYLLNYNGPGIPWSSVYSTETGNLSMNSKD